MSRLLSSGWLVLLACVACADHDVTVEYFPGDGHEIGRRGRRAIQRIADATALEVRRFLPGLPARLTLEVETGTEVIDETGEGASAHPPDRVSWMVDATRPGGAGAIIEAQLRSTLFHEFHHLVRDARIERSSLLDAAVAEGMATAFERDQTGAPAPWGDYPADVAGWVAELRALPDSVDRRPWLFRHPDGRRWIAYKVGTYLVDRATAASGKSPAELVTTPTNDVIEMALGDRP